MIINPTIEQLKTLKNIIYLIRNKINGMCYVGQTIRYFTKRYLRNEWWKYTSNIYLLRAAEKYGYQNFEISIIEHGILNQDELNKLEKYYSEIYNSIVPNGYNLKECGGSKGKPHELSVFKHTKKYTFINPNGDIIKFRNLKKFCEENGLFEGAMFKVKKGQIPHHKYWTKYDKNTPLFYHEKIYKYVIKSPVGEIIKIINLAQFCRKNNFCERGVQGVVSGQLPHYKGYTLVENRRNPNVKGMEKREGNIKDHLFINPQNQVQKIRNLKKFCRENNLSHSCMTKVKCDLLTSYKDWKKFISN